VAPHPRAQVLLMPALWAPAFPACQNPNEGFHSLHMDVAGNSERDVSVTIFCISNPMQNNRLVIETIQTLPNVYALMQRNLIRDSETKPSMIAFGWRDTKDNRVYFLDYPNDLEGDRIYYTIVQTISFRLYGQKTFPKNVPPYQ